MLASMRGYLQVYENKVRKRADLLSSKRQKIIRQH